VIPLMFQERMRRVEDELGGRWVEGWVVARGFEGREGRGGVERRRRLRGGGEREDERSCKFISGCGRWCATPALSARATKVKISSKKWGPTSPRFPLRPSRCLLQGPPHHHPNNLSRVPKRTPHPQLYRLNSLQAQEFHFTCYSLLTGYWKPWPLHAQSVILPIPISASNATQALTARPSARRLIGRATSYFVLKSSQ